LQVEFRVHPEERREVNSNWPDCEME